MTTREALALAFGMNARGSTEVVVATIGISVGLLSQPIFTLIVIVAITTTITTPPILKWLLAGIPPRGEERERLEREAAEADLFVPHVERILAVTEERCGRLAEHLAGLFAGSRQVMTTILPLDVAADAGRPATAERARQTVTSSAEHGSRQAAGHATSGTKPEAPEVIVASKATADPAEAVLAEAAKGYDMIFIGSDRTPSQASDGCGAVVDRVAREFAGVMAIAIGAVPESLRIMVPVTGTDYSRRAAEVAVALAKAARTSVTVLHVARPNPEMGLTRLEGEATTPARAVVREVETIARQQEVPFRSRVRTHRLHEQVILDELTTGRHSLLVLGVNARPGDRLSLGDTTEEILRRTDCAVLLVKS
jgi:nucleotide-binding universal stress UspA family protein